MIASTGLALAQPPSATAPSPVAPPLEPDGAYGSPPVQPPAQDATNATFQSTTDLQWDVTIGEELACTTPCRIAVPALGFVVMHSHERPPVRLDVGFLPPGHAIVAAEPMHPGEYAAGVTFATLGRASLVTGIVLGAVGSSTRSRCPSSSRPPLGFRSR